MGDQTQGCRGKAGIWAGITGLVVAVFLVVVAHEPLYVAIFMGLLTVLLFGAFLIWAFCSGTGAPGEAESTSGAHPATPTPPRPETVSDIEAPVSAFKAQSPEGEAAHKQAEATLPEAAKSETATSETAKPAATSAAATPAAVMSAPAPAPKDTTAPAKADSQPAVKTAAAPKAAAKPAAKKVGAKPASKKPAAAKPATKPAAKAAAPKASAAATDTGAQVGGKKPTGLKAPRASGADDLTKIEGIGPKLAETLNGWGVYHFDQIAKWGADEVAYADTNVPRFKGRCTRDKWVSQAKIIVGEGMEAFLERAKTNDY
ncbi:hypothetical protein AB4874_14315 [Thioclava sp. 15-R06ZXC-3]|uniref:NADH:quinone oxidoreductase n=1 Tax=Thioclava arctica TaxID=3238301 RepID=A0ABV3TMK1_9RHOB